MPALQTLLLFAKSIDTNNNFSRIVFDSWIEARFPNPIEGYFGFEVFSYLNLEVFRANEKECQMKWHVMEKKLVKINQVKITNRR